MRVLVKNISLPSFDSNMMKRQILLLAIFCLYSLTCISQNWYSTNVANTDLRVIDIKDAIEEYGEQEPYEIWLDSGKGIYAMMFKMTPVGYKHSLDKVKEILAVNDLSFEDDRIRQSVLISPICDDYDDYHCMPSMIEIGSAEVDIEWRTKDGDSIQLDCDDEFFKIVLTSYNQ